MIYSKIQNKRVSIFCSVVHVSTLALIKLKFTDGFRKMTNIENSGLRSERDDMEFYHQYFVKGHEIALENIKRKV